MHPNDVINKSRVFLYLWLENFVRDFTRPGHNVSHAGTQVVKLYIGTSKTKAGQNGLVRVALFWKSHCVTCNPVCVSLYYVTGMCLGPIPTNRLTSWNVESLQQERACYAIKESFFFLFFNHIFSQWLWKIWSSGKTFSAFKRQRSYKRYYAKCMKSGKGSFPFDLAKESYSYRSSVFRLYMTVTANRSFVFLQAFHEQIFLRVDTNRCELFFEERHTPSHNPCKMLKLNQEFSIE